MDKPDSIKIEACVDKFNKEWIAKNERYISLLI